MTKQDQELWDNLYCAFIGTGVSFETAAQSADEALRYRNQRCKYVPLTQEEEDEQYRQGLLMSSINTIREARQKRLDNQSQEHLQDA